MVFLFISDNSYLIPVVPVVVLFTALILAVLILTDCTDTDTDARCFASN
jgi:hypothetical protein